MRLNDLVTCFKILKGRTSITPTEFFLHCLGVPLEDTPSSYTAQIGELMLPGTLFFAVRVIHVWNRLHPHMVAVDDVTSCARGLDSLSTEFFSTIDSERHIVSF